jgi:aspartate/methionine/tyrosine aminotransferase
LNPTEDRLFSWVLDLGPKAKYNLSSSGLSEPDLSEMGVETAYHDYGPEKNDHFRELEFVEEVAALYGVEPENVVPTAGASEAIFLVYSTLGAGCRALVPLPNYPAMFTVPKALGLEVSSNLTSSRGSGVIIGLTDPNNPTGRLLDESTTDRVAKGTVVFVNETYKGFASGPQTTVFGKVPGAVVCSTMTKFFGLGRLRVGWVVADKQSSKRLLYAKWAVSGHDSEYSLWIATQVLRNRQRFTDRAGKLLSTNTKLVRKFLAETKGVSAEMGKTPFCLVRYRNGPNSIALARALFAKTGVLVSPGDFFGAPKTFRLCFTADEETLDLGLEELSKVFNRT